KNDDSNEKKKRTLDKGNTKDSYTELDANLETHLVKRRRRTTEQEKEILKAILDDDSFSESKALTILQQLTDQGEEGWTLQRIRVYWNNH
ncbi:20170_t:CDS:1, partial [Racocetra persica]